MGSYAPPPVLLASFSPAPIHKTLWGNGLLCAYERVPNLKTKPHEQSPSKQSYCWQAIGWKRLSVLAAMRNDIEKGETENPTWWAHFEATDAMAQTWINFTPLLSPMARQALLDEERPMVHVMKPFLYEVPFRTKDSILFELTGQLATVASSEPFSDVLLNVVMRAFLSDTALVTVRHVKDSNHHAAVPSGHRCFGIEDLQASLELDELNCPQSVHDVVAFLAGRLATWDDRIWRRDIFWEADEIELKYMNRGEDEEDITNFTLILDNEIKKLTSKVITVKWELHAREEILSELKLLCRSPYAKGLLDEALEDTREMLGEQDSVRDRLFDLQDVLIGARRAVIQDRSLWVQHNLAVVGGAGILASIVAGVFGVNLDGIPGNTNHPHAFTIFCSVLMLVFFLLLSIGYTTIGMHRRRRKQDRVKLESELKHVATRFRETFEGHGFVHKQHPTPPPT